MRNNFATLFVSFSPSRYFFLVLKRAPSGVVRFHDIVVVSQKGTDQMSHWEQRPSYRLHAKNAAEGVVGAWEVHLHL
jgi:hypothetical protein